LTGTARRLFAERGYAHVPADEIVAAAGVTRGAMYHHYADKQHLFRAVFEELESEVTVEVAAATTRAREAGADARATMVAALTCYLDACARPEVTRIALTDGPAVLGWATWRELEASHGLGLISAGLQAFAQEGRLAAASTAIPVLAQLVLGAVIEAALLIAHAEDPIGTRQQAEQGLLTLLAGLDTQKN